MNSISSQIASATDFLSLEPEQVALLALAYISTLPAPEYAMMLNRYRFTTCAHFTDAFGPDDREPIRRVLLEAWNWLEANGFIVTTGMGGCVFTRKAEQLMRSGELKRRENALALRKDFLHPTIAGRAFPYYRRGEYAKAIFEAFKFVEISVRATANLDDSFIGVKLMRAAFGKENGILTDLTRVEAERDARYCLFAGAIGAYKNPYSHRDVQTYDPREAAELLVFASHLLRIVDECSARPNAQRPESAADAAVECS